MAYHEKTTAICEVSVMSLTMKEVYFIAGRSCIEHSIFGEMIGWPLPFELAIG